MKHNVNLSWIGNKGFEYEADDHKVIFDVPTDMGGDNRGMRPKPFLMASLAVCSGMDVVSILEKMRITLKSFNIEVDGDVTEEHPKQYTKMHVTYVFEGENLPMDKLEKAVKLSEEKYCGVRAMFHKSIELSSEIKIK